VADGLAADDVDVHYDTSNNYCSAVDCQNRRKNCLCKSCLVFGLFPNSNVNNCKPARRPQEATVHAHDREVRAIEETAREHFSPTIDAMVALPL